jgi:hypothetical protein
MNKIQGSGKCCTARQGLIDLPKLRMKYMTELASADIQLIQAILPHRYPFLLVDRVEDIDGVKSARGIKNVTMNEPHFQGHFPGTPIMPGVTIVEAPGANCRGYGWGHA